MLSEFNKRKMRYLVLPTRFIEEKYQKDLNRAYECWKSVWEDAFHHEMHVEGPLYSDNFSRQSHVGVLFLGQEPVALTTMNYLNLDQIIDKDDSYFKVWSQEALTNLRNEAKIILMCSNVTLDFKYRNNALGIKAKDLILALQTRYMKHSTADAVVAAVRLEKGMERAAYRTGAFAFAKDLAYTIPGQRVDLVCWTKSLDEEKCLDPEILEILNYIWTHSTVIVGRHQNEGEIYVA